MPAQKYATVSGDAIYMYSYEKYQACVVCVAVDRFKKSLYWYD